MHWLDSIDAAPVGMKRTSRMQMIMLPSTIADLRAHNVRSVQSNLPAGEINDAPNWLAVDGSRLLAFEGNGAALTERLTLFTPFLETVDEDWRILESLWHLPSWLGTHAPSFIESRVVGGSHVVARPTAAGWTVPIYHASSAPEAERCLAFMQKDRANASCLVETADAPGDWGVFEVVDGTERQIACYPDRPTALEVAGRISGRNADHQLTARNLLTKQEYLLKDGRLLSTTNHGYLQKSRDVGRLALR